MIMSLFLILTGGFMLFYFNRRLLSLGVIADFHDRYSSLVSQILAVILALTVFNLLYQLSPVSLLTRLGEGWALSFLYYRLSSPIKNSKSVLGYISLTVWFFIYGFGSMPNGIRLGILPFYFLATIIISIVVESNLISQKGEKAQPPGKLLGSTNRNP